MNTIDINNKDYMINTININDKDYTVININTFKRKRESCTDDKLIEIELHKNKKLKQFNNDLETIEFKMKNIRITKRKSIDILENDINKKIKLIHNIPIELEPIHMRIDKRKSIDILENDINKKIKINESNELNKSNKSNKSNEPTPNKIDDVYEYDYEYFSGLSPRKTIKLNKDDLIYRYIN